MISKTAAFPRLWQHEERGAITSLHVNIMPQLMQPRTVLTFKFFHAYQAHVEFWKNKRSSVHFTGTVFMSRLPIFSGLQLILTFLVQEPHIYPT